ncbi:MAG: single-stranded-DNA-specific exonuclease RecJ [Lewinellaceae bacterium]|nr:single-stranded-DNA-specific exonuclease RecJ [Lewinellaceae bacterium]
MPAPRWQMRHTDAPVAQYLHDALGIHPLLCGILAQRGIATFDEARHFFRPALADLHHPFLMHDMEHAVKRLDQATQNNERILLYGDYDVDGTTSVALMYTFLSGFYPNLDYYLPDRDKEGYGVSAAGVEYARNTGATLVVAMDCGVKAHQAVALAKSYGIDFIVCDHHLPDADLPAAVAVLDPKRPDCPYPYKELSGCGVAFKLAQALALHWNTPAEELSPLLDLVAVSICCDLVPMTGENRVLVHLGLHSLNREPRLGLWALIQRSGRRYPLAVSDVVFGIGPMINAAGRLGDAREAVRVLLAADRNSAMEAAGALAVRNRERRKTDQNTAEVARRRVLDDPAAAGRKSIVLFDPHWHKGIIGIAAGRMVELFHRPTVILTQSGSKAVGSARSVPGFDLHTALSRCEHLFSSFGGHAFAAGVQMPLENVPVFINLFEKIVCETIPKEAEMPEIEINGLLNFADITPAFWRTLRQFAPFGPGNMTPVFWAREVTDTGQSRLLANNHVRLSVRQGNSPVFSGVGFGLGEAFQTVQGKPFDLAFSLFDDDWHGEKVLALMVRGIRPASSDVF